MAIRDLRDVDAETIESYRRKIYLAGLSLDTRVWRQSVLSGFFGWLTRRRHLATDPMKDVPRLRRRLKEKIPVLTKEEIARLFRCPPAPPPVRGHREPLKFFQRRLELHVLAELRDRALVELLYDIPLRGGEPSLLERRDYDEAKREIDIRGAKWADDVDTFPVLKSTAAAPSIYLSALDRSRWGMHPALFPPLGSRRADSRRPTSGIGQAEVNRILKRRIARAGIEAKGRRLTSHCLRYSRATSWHESGVSIIEISALLRHQSPSTVIRYVRLGPLKRMKRRADRASLFRRVNFEIPPG